MAVEPKYSRSTMDVLNNYYVVQNGLLFDYYPISTKPERNGKFIFLDVSPPVWKSGVAIIDRIQYDVSVQDIIRRRVNVSKSKQLTRSATNNTSTSSSSFPGDGKKAGESNIGSGGSSPLGEVQHPNQLGVDDSIGDEERQAVDLAWDQQVGTLLQTLHSEKGEWEIASAPQSRRANSSRPV